MITALAIGIPAAIFTAGCLWITRDGKGAHADPTPRFRRREREPQPEPDTLDRLTEAHAVAEAWLAAPLPHSPDWTGTTLTHTALLTKEQAERLQQIADAAPEITSVIGERTADDWLESRFRKADARMVAVFAALEAGAR